MTVRLPADRVEQDDDDDKQGKRGKGRYCERQQEEEAPVESQRRHPPPGHLSTHGGREGVGPSQKSFKKREGAERGTNC